MYRQIVIFLNPSTLAKNTIFMISAVCKYIVLALFWKVFIKFRHWHDEKLTIAYQWVRRTILFIALRTSSKVLNVDPCFSAQCFSLREYGFHAVLAHFSWKLQKILTFLVNFWSLFWHLFWFFTEIEFQTEFPDYKTCQKCLFYLLSQKYP